MKYGVSYKGSEPRHASENEKCRRTYPLYLAIADSANPPQSLVGYHRRGTKILEHTKVSMLLYDVDLRSGDYIVTWQETLSPPRMVAYIDYQIGVEFHEHMIY